MAPDPLVIAELRAMFKSAATPSRLMRHIIAHHGSHALPEIDRLIRAYFREAFCVPMFRASASLLALGPEGLLIAGINASVIHRMIEARGEWDQDAKAEGGAVETWMDSLVATDQGSLNDRVHPELSSEFAGVWDQFDDSTKQSIKRLIGNSQGLYEQVNILSVLVEQLQMQIVAQENQNQQSVCKESEASNGAWHQENV
jgi:hypothetical protein